MTKKAVLFDMDGTLVDTVDDLAAALNFTLRTLGLPEKSRSEVKGCLGMGIPVMVDLALPPEKKGVREEAIKIFRGYYKEHLTDFTRPYEGIPELVKELKDKGFHLAVISNKIQSALEDIVHRFFGDSFEVIIGQRDDLPQKPAPDSVYLALDIMGLKKENSVYIGDSDVDMKTAFNAGVDLVSCSWGFKTKEELVSFGAKTIINEPLQLLKLI